MPEMYFLVKQWAFFNAEHLHCFFPKMLKVIHKKLFMKSS